jgi:hypothetical protein
VIGRETNDDGQGMVQTLRWIGKPWRRIELLVSEFYWKGELAERSWDLTLHLGSRRLGWAVTWSISRSAVMDYSEERP